MSKRMKLEIGLQRGLEEQTALRGPEKAVRKELRNLSQKTTRRSEMLLGRAYLKLTKARGDVTPTAIFHTVITDAKVTDIDAIEVLKERLGLEDAEPIANPTSPNDGSQSRLGCEASDVVGPVAGKTVSGGAIRRVAGGERSWWDATAAVFWFGEELFPTDSPEPQPDGAGSYSHGSVPMGGGRG